MVLNILTSALPVGTVELAGAKQRGEEALQQRCRRRCQLAEMARKSGGISAEETLLELR